MLKIKPKGDNMTGNFSVLQEGSTLIGDHKTAVQALEDVLAATTTDEAKKTAKTALKAIGEPGYSEDDVKTASAAHETSGLTLRDK